MINMNPNSSIRIIKSAQRMSTSKTIEPQVQPGASSRQRSRDVAGHVSAWVREFKQRRRQDPRRAFESLFVDSATPLNSFS